MKRWLARFAALAGMVLAPFWVAEGGTVHGTVTNGTTGKPAALIRTRNYAREERAAPIGAIGATRFAIDSL